MALDDSLLQISFGQYSKDIAVQYPPLVRGIYVIKHLSLHDSPHLFSDTLSHTWANNTLAAIISSCSSLGVFFFIFCQAEQPDQKKLETRRFARKSWPLLNILETVLLLPVFLQKWKKNKKYSASDTENAQEVDAKALQYIIISENFEITVSN